MAGQLLTDSELCGLQRFWSADASTATAVGSGYEAKHGQPAQPCRSVSATAVT